MPADPDKSTEKLAKSVDTITKLLQAHSGNPAQIKAQKEEEKKLIKDHKKVLGQWEEVLDDEKKQLEENKVGISTMTSFIGLEAKKYFAQSESNGVTWGGLAKSLGVGIKSWFDAASKQNTMLGRTLRLGASLWKGVNDHIIGTVKNVFGKIGSQMREVLGELAEVFDFIKGIFMGLFNFVKDAFLGFFKRVPPQDKLRNKLLQKLVDFSRRAEKRDMLEFGIPDKSIQGLLLPLALIAAALVGGMVRRFLMPFEAIWRVFRIGKILKSLQNFLMSFAWFGRLIKPFVGVGGLVDKVIQIQGKFMKWLPRFSKMLGKLFGMFKFGFKILGWPLAIIIGVIDFIRAFVSAEGNLADRITAGVKGAIIGFIELPVKLIGWIIEKILGIFGVEVDGIADKVLGFIKGFIDFWVGMFRPIIGLIEGLFTGGFSGAIEGFFGGVKDFLDILKPWIEKLEPLRQAIIDFFVAIGDWFGSLIDKFKPLLSWFGIELGGGGGEVGGQQPVGSSLATVSQAEANAKEAQQKSQTDAVVDAIDNQTQKTMEQNEKISKDQGENIAVAMATGGDTKPGGGGGEEKQIPESAEIYGLIMSNSNAF